MGQERSAVSHSVAPPPPNSSGPLAYRARGRPEFGSAEPTNMGGGGTKTNFIPELEKGIWLSLKLETLAQAFSSALMSRGVARGGTYCDLLPASAALGICLLPTLEFCAGGLRCGLLASGPLHPVPLAPAPYPREDLRSAS